MNTRSKPRRASPPLDEERLHELALRYVGKYASTRSKLRSYLSRKLRERGWNGPRDPDLERLAERFAELGYVDDAGYALSKSRALSARGYGKRRVADKLRIAGVGEEDRAPAIAFAEGEAVDSVLRYAERRRIGPFATEPPDPRQREKWIAAMVRAGHRFDIARALANFSPRTEIDRAVLVERLRGEYE